MAGFVLCLINSVAAATNMVTDPLPSNYADDGTAQFPKLLST